MRVAHHAICLFELQSRSDISVATVLQMGLEEKALDLAAFGLLLGLDLMERELELSLIHISRQSAGGLWCPS